MIVVTHGKSPFFGWFWCGSSTYKPASQGAGLSFPVLPFMAALQHFPKQSSRLVHGICFPSLGKKGDISNSNILCLK
tara:strand:- start:15 stop:245 length:231 start_codon:yes stop_codon:yes gene_type:complete